MKVLLVVDVQNDFVTGALANPEAQKRIPRIKEKIQQRIDEGWTVMFTQDTHQIDYLETSEDIQTKTDKLVGTDFKNFLIDNQFTPFNQLVAKNVVAYDELIDYMEEENTRFQNSDVGLIAPFKTIFSYHTGEDENLIIQSRDFAEIASSVGGGVGCSYRQDTEIVYDMEGKMVLWQTSLGISTSAPQGTMRQGYILEVQVEWIEKV